jgi:hypothetical protein
MHFAGAELCGNPPLRPACMATAPAPGEGARVLKYEQRSMETSFSHWAGPAARQGRRSFLLLFGK